MSYQLIIDALRSGLYTQCKFNLSLVDREGNCSYCIAGLACELYRQATGNGIWSKQCNNRQRAFYLGDFASAGTIPNEVQNWFGWSSHVLGTVMGMNDEGKTFESIATKLENLCQK